MRKQGTSILKFWGGDMGSYISLDENATETMDYIIPDSVSITLMGEGLRPTSYDNHGNPRFQDIAANHINHKLKKMEIDGLISSEYKGLVEYSYETTDFAPIAQSFKLLLPQPEICQICGKPFDINHFTHETVCEISQFRSELAHRECKREYLKLSNIIEFLYAFRGAFNSYRLPDGEQFNWGSGKNGMTYELIPNEYYDPNSENPRPWFMLHTPIGDIKCGWRNNVISIQWQENYPAFDMAIFNGINVTKYVGNEWIGESVSPGTMSSEVREIHTASTDNMAKYLLMAREAVLIQKD